MTCTIVLVCDSAADLSKWDRTRAPILRAGHSVVTPVIDRKSLVEDAATVTEVVHSIEGPVLLVGHAYGGAVISAVSASSGDIAGLAFVEAFAPEPGESCASLSTMFRVNRGNSDSPQAHSALNDTVLTRPLWRNRPTWFAFGDQDREIPARLHHYMAKRAASRHTVEIPGAMHGIAASHPAETADLILEAADLPRWAEPLIP